LNIAKQFRAASCDDKTRAAEGTCRSSSSRLEEVAHAEGPSESQGKAITAFKPMIGLAPARGWGAAPG
jgi:hypothetical protein